MQTDGYSLGELAVRFGLELRGDPNLRVSRVATLHHAGPGSISFFANARYRKALAATEATAVVISAQDLEQCPVAALIDANPYLSYARIATTLYPVSLGPPGIDPSSTVSPQAQIDPSVTIGPHSVIEAGVQLAARVYVGAGCIVQAGARIGADTRLMSRVTLCAGSIVGERCIFHPGVVIGADGFGFAIDSGTWFKVPQVGAVRIGDDVEIGANTTIDRGAIDDTVVENGVKLDNQIQIGHNVTIGAHTAIASCTGISGSTTIGKRCMIGGLVGMAGHLTIADDVVITGLSMITASIPKAGSYSSGIPAEETKIWWRRVAQFRRLGANRPASHGKRFKE
ncbi:MAG: UDP-3-O-(3-hydroxymyristoyl)glucosamine N-acyltransferase [Steroidobacteraceae bacterium]